MADTLTPSKRSEMMSRIRSKDTKPETMVRSGLHRAGFRFRLHARSLPGRPDIVLRKHNAVIQVNGCFWHGHRCHLFRWPGSRETFWREKIEGNRARDRRNVSLLRRSGWKTAIVWECSLKGKTSIGTDAVVERLARWLGNNEPSISIRGKRSR